MILVEFILMVLDNCWLLIVSAILIKKKLGLTKLTDEGFRFNLEQIKGS